MDAEANREAVWESWVDDVSIAHGSYHFPHSDEVVVVRARVCIDIAISWRHSLTNYAAAILITGLMRRTLSPTWNGSKQSTRRLVTIPFDASLLTVPFLSQTGLGSRPPSTAEVPPMTATRVLVYHRSFSDL